jgi:hypothetical protein
LDRITPPEVPEVVRADAVGVGVAPGVRAAMVVVKDKAKAKVETPVAEAAALNGGTAIIATEAAAVAKVS